MRTPAAAFRFELLMLSRDPADLMVLLNTPLLTVIFLSVTRHAGRADLSGYAVLAPAVMALWSMALLVSGEVIDRERWGGTLELLVAAPTALASVVLGRIGAVTMVSLVSLLESWLVARVGFGITIAVAHPGLFIAVLAATALAMAGTATAMSGLFVLARTARTFQNSLSYPFFILGGALVPVDLLPDWLRPLSRCVFLSWSSDLLRDCLSAAAVADAPRRLATVVGLGVAGYVVGFWMLRHILTRVRRNGTVSQA